MEQKEIINSITIAVSKQHDFGRCQAQVTYVITPPPDATMPIIAGTTDIYQQMAETAVAESVKRQEELDPVERPPIQQVLSNKPINKNVSKPPWE